MVSQHPELTPKWSESDQRPPRGSRSPTILAIVLIVVLAIAVVFVAIKYKSTPAGHTPESVPLLQRKK